MELFANIMGFAGADIWVVAGVVVLLFGGSKIPGLFKSIGEGMKEFKKATNEMHDEPTPLVNQPTTAAMAETGPHTAEATTARPAGAPITKE
jgi:sec-independent protein translocase protein TatA